jgi:ketosteroid isomerase-like protein
VPPPTGPPVGTIGSSSGGASIPPPPPPVDEKPGILAAINRYEQAYARLDADAVVAAVESLRPERNKLAQDFRNMERQSVSILNPNIVIQGGTRATVTATRQIKAQPKGAREQTSSGAVTIQLEKRPSGWAILDIRR